MQPLFFAYILLINLSSIFSFMYSPVLFLDVLENRARPSEWGGVPLLKLAQFRGLHVERWKAFAINWNSFRLEIMQKKAAKTVYTRKFANTLA